MSGFIHTKPKIPFELAVASELTMSERLKNILTVICMFAATIAITIWQKG